MKTAKELKTFDHIIDIVGEIIDDEIDVGVAIHRLNKIITQREQDIVDEYKQNLDKYLSGKIDKDARSPILTFQLINDCKPKLIGDDKG